MPSQLAAVICGCSISRNISGSTTNMKLFIDGAHITITEVASTQWQ